MPSMWQWMCFNKLYRKRKPKKGSELSDNFGDLQDSLRLRKKHKFLDNSPSFFCSTELQNQNISDDIIRFDLPQFEEDKGTHAKLLTTKKKRPDNPFRKLGRSLEKGKFLFKPFSTPNVNSNLDSMYGYVPKAVQDVYASSALEGEQIDDYYEDNYMYPSFGEFEAITKDDCIPSGKSSGRLSNFAFSKQFRSTPTLSERQNLLDEVGQIEESDTQTEHSKEKIHLGHQFSHKLDKMMEMESFWKEEADVFY